MKKRKKWTEEELNLLKQHYGKMSLNNLKLSYFPDRHIGTIYGKAKKLNLVGFESKPRIEFNTTWSSELAYFIGLMASDGCIKKSNTYLTVIKLQKSDQEILDRLHSLFEIGNVYETSDGMYNYRIYNKSLYDFLVSIGIQERKSENLSWPKIPKKYHKDFIRGFFDGDGYIFEGARGFRSGYCSASKEFLEKLLHVVQQEAGVKSRSISKSTRCFEIKLYKKDTESICKWMYYPGCLSMKRKRVKAEKLLEERKLSS